MKSLFTRFLFLLLFCVTGPQAWAQLNHIKVDSINSSYDEQNPRLSPDGQTLYFTRSGHPENVGGARDKGDIWYSNRKAGGGWSTPQNARSLNHEGLNGVVGFSPDGTTIYLLNYYDPNGAGGGKLRNGIATATRQNGTWSAPKRLSIKYFANQSTYISGTISADEKIMVISISSFQTYGNEDLYVTFKQPDGTWLQPRSLGPVINTIAQEWSPFLSNDMSTLYFSSNGHGGEGSRDIFMAKRLDESWTNWSKPVNMGAAINSKGVELGYSIPPVGDMAFFSTTQNSEGFGDIFNFPLTQTEKEVQETVVLSVPDQAAQDPAPVVVAEPEPQRPVTPQKDQVVMTMQVLDIKTEEPIEALVTLNFGGNEEKVDTRNIEGEDKKWIMSFEEGTLVKVNIIAEGYLNYEEEFVAEAGAIILDPDQKTVEGFRLTPSTIGTKMRIETILFTRGQAAFADTTRAFENLDKLAAMLAANPDVNIRLEGHTDTQGNPKLLKKLSEDRVEAVKAYLVSKGIAANRVETVGYGGEQPLLRNTTDKKRQENRRVEFVIIR